MLNKPNANIWSPWSTLLTCNVLAHLVLFWFHCFARRPTSAYRRLVCVLPARAFPAAHGKTRHNLWPGCRPAHSASSSCPALWRAGAFYAAGDGPITRPGGRNSAFVMVVISLLCFQVELRWNSTGSHCVPIFRTLKEICWVLKGWNEAHRAWADLALWWNTQWEQSCPSVSFCARLNLS